MQSNMDLQEPLVDIKSYLVGILHNFEGVLPLECRCELNYMLDLTDKALLNKDNVMDYLDIIECEVLTLKRDNRIQDSVKKHIISDVNNILDVLLIIRENLEWRI